MYLFQIAVIAEWESSRMHSRVGEYGGSGQSADLQPQAWEAPSTFSCPEIQKIVEN